MGEVVQIAKHRREPLVRIDEVAAELSMSVSWVEKQAKKELDDPGTGLPSYKVGGARRLRMSEVWERVERTHDDAA